MKCVLHYGMLLCIIRSRSPASRLISFPHESLLLFYLNQNVFFILACTWFSGDSTHMCHGTLQLHYSCDTQIQFISAFAFSASLFYQLCTNFYQRNVRKKQKKWENVNFMVCNENPHIHWHLSLVELQMYTSLLKANRKPQSSNMPVIWCESFAFNSSHAKELKLIKHHFNHENHIYFKSHWDVRVYRVLKAVRIFFNYKENHEAVMYSASHSPPVTATLALRNPFEISHNSHFITKRKLFNFLFTKRKSKPQSWKVLHDASCIVLPAASENVNVFSSTFSACFLVLKFLSLCGVAAFFSLSQSALHNAVRWAIISYPAHNFSGSIFIIYGKWHSVRFHADCEFHNKTFFICKSNTQKLSMQSPSRSIKLWNRQTEKVICDVTHNSFNLYCNSTSTTSGCLSSSFTQYRSETCLTSPTDTRNSSDE